MNYRRFKVGDIVGAHQTITVESHGRHRRLYKHERTVSGKVTGLKRFQLGTIESDSSYDEYGANGTNYLNVKEVITVWEVRIGLFNNPVYVLDEDLLPAVYPHNYRLPVQYQNKNSWTDEQRKELRECMSGVPRDSKGRWI